MSDNSVLLIIFAVFGLGLVLISYLPAILLIQRNKPKTSIPNATERKKSSIRSKIEMLSWVMGIIGVLIIIYEKLSK